MSDIRLLSKNCEVFTHILPEIEGKESSDLRTEYKLFPATLWAKKWKPLAKNFYPKPPYPTEERKVFWENRYRLMINGKWHKDKAQYCLMTRSEFFKFIVERML